MTTLHVANAFNVEGSLNDWFNTAITAVTRPSFLPTFTVVFNLPDTPIVTPGISVAHHPVEVQNKFQGGHVGSGESGGGAVALMDISCWVSRDSGAGARNENWNGQLMILRSMVQGLFAGKTPLVLSNYVTDPTSPSAVAYKIDFRSCEYVETAHDPNPAIERARYLVRYEYTARAVS